MPLNPLIKVVQAGYVYDGSRSKCDKIIEGDYNSTMGNGFHCPDGYALISSSTNNGGSGVCEKSVDIPESGTCPVGYTQDGAACIATQSAYQGCPSRIRL
ncbi:hypothetical protein L3081_24255 [Colwellia sp. MSW7]|uniref:Uncharacterized protein n=1 Tax=Colwellia maritima TaxID=2912588 RepID=A0ABS9X828_9GAMM|nr:hypothetical protein [Colwellia maritima]MCI2285942.1 hypothetical protein [Colwellia maritima]